VVWVALAITLCLHFINLGAIEYLGQDEPEVHQTALRLLRADPDVLTPLRDAWQPPVRYIVSAAGLMLFGPSEMGLRFFHALSGVAILFALRAIVRPLGQRVEAVTLLMYGAIAPAVLHRVAHGHGVFIATALWIFVLTECRTRTGRLAALLLLPLLLLNSFEGILFYPYVFVRCWQARRALPVLAWLAGAAVALAPVALIGRLWLGRVNAFGVEQLMRRSDLPGIGVLNVDDKLALYWSALTPAFAVLAVGALALTAIWLARGPLNAPDRLGRMALFFAPHTLVWLLLMPQPMSHPLWDYAIIVAYVGWAWGKFSLIQPRWAVSVLTACITLGGVLAFDSFNRPAAYAEKLAHYYGAVSIPACPPDLGP
jgi:hypothetical protein